MIILNYITSHFFGGMAIISIMFPIITLAKLYTMSAALHLAIISHPCPSYVITIFTRHIFVYPEFAYSLRLVAPHTIFFYYSTPSINVKALEFSFKVSLSMVRERQELKSKVKGSFDSVEEY